jgi:signal transduction histidine kinase
VAFKTDLRYAGDLTVDVERLKRAILNIASNALDAMGPGGTFTFSSRLEDSFVDLVLSDTGHGIPAELQGRIFEPFFTHGKARGIGLGMSITRKIIEEHGGRIQLESRLGEGTRFTLQLPLDPSPSRAPEPVRSSGS